MAINTRVVITGVGLASPNGSNLADFREGLLTGRSGIEKIDVRYMGEVCAGTCEFDVFKYQRRKEARRGTRAGAIAIYCAHEAMTDAGLDLETVDRSMIGIYVGTTEHGNVETENEIYNISQFDYDVKFWSHHHNPRTVANNPAGEISINMGITGPHYCIGAACAAGNIGIIQGVQQLQLGEIDLALAGGISESIHTFGIFAAFQSQTALAKHDDPTKASRPFDVDRNGIVVSEGGCLFTLERLEDALKRNATIYGEIVGYGINSDATDFVLPNADRQTECMNHAIKRAGLTPEDIDIVSCHATGTPAGDVEESKAVRNVFGNSDKTYVNNTKSFIGHCMGAAGSLELAGNLPSFQDRIVHPGINVDRLDPACDLKNLVINEPKKDVDVKVILNNSFGMLGINSSVIVKRYDED
jgi:3-oxoacyl-[acyl-carrier-protein] synthase II